jgi:hypothetical protein
MNGDALNEEVLHRCWLLAKALESASLDKALEVARAADEFLRGGEQTDAAPALPIAAGVPEAPAADSYPVLDETEPAPAEVAAVVVEGVRAAKPTIDPGTSALIEDVVRYLRQRDDTVVRQGEDLFLVNGRFRMSSDELISRANRMRERAGKSTFQVRALEPIAGRVMPSADFASGVTEARDTTTACSTGR